MSYLFPNYQRYPFEIVSGSGCMVQDHQGKNYLDLTSGIGVTALGHCHPKVKENVTEQIEKIWHVSNLYESSLQEKTATLLDKNNDYLAFFCNSGTEANEAAIKLARKSTGKTKIITFDASFHGRTYGSMSATAQEKIKAGFGPLLPDFVHVPFNNFPALVAVLDDNVAAVMTELIQGESGVRLADAEYMVKVQKLCKEKETLLIIDEVQTGIGRTGTLFCYEQYQIEPDMITLAKGLGNGFPIGALLGKKQLREDFGPGSHGSTFGGNPLALTAACAVLQEIEEKQLLLAAKAKGKYLKKLLDNKLSEHPSITEIRGMGLMIGIETTLPIHEVITKAQAAGLLILPAGEQTLRLLPPLIITEAELEAGVNILADVVTNRVPVC